MIFAVLTVSGGPYVEATFPGFKKNLPSTVLWINLSILATGRRLAWRGATSIGLGLGAQEKGIGRFDQWINIGADDAVVGEALQQDQGDDEVGADLGQEGFGAAAILRQ